MKRVLLGSAAGICGQRAGGLRERLTPTQRIPDLRAAERHCEASHREGFGSIALAQAFIFDLGMRQKDMIGEWVPRSKPGVTDVFSGGSKWLMGARWEEIDEQFVWKHRLSKSVTREGIMDLETGKTELFELSGIPPRAA